jgi:hypothetical protein
VKRRAFIGICAAGAATGIDPALAAALSPRFYSRAAAGRQIAATIARGVIVS